MFAFDIDILTEEEEKRMNSFFNNSDKLKFKKNSETRKQKMLRLKRSNKGEKFEKNNKNNKNNKNDEVNDKIRKKKGMFNFSL